jgi:pimeloyl-ACP methyl ester carboxylesterase
VNARPGRVALANLLNCFRIAKAILPVGVLTSLMNMKVTIATLLLSLLTGVAHAQAGDSPPSTQPDATAALEAKTLYYPEAYEGSTVDAFLQTGGSRLDFKTSQGKQTAWLITPAKRVKPQRLWVVCCGNAMPVLYIAPFIRQTDLPSDAFVLVDYPGYGLCEGNPSPASIRENVKAATLAAAGPTGIDAARDAQRVCVLGHSLGCAAALFAVEEFHLKSAVLCSPFTSTHEMAELRDGLAKDAPYRNQFDNRLGLAELRKNSGHAWIIHGSVDQVIPVTMSKTMADEFKDVVKLEVIDGAGHNDIMQTGKKEVLAAMSAARE